MTTEPALNSRGGDFTVGNDEGGGGWADVNEIEFIMPCNMGERMEQVHTVD